MFTFVPLLRQAKSNKLCHYTMYVKNNNIKAQIHDPNMCLYYWRQIIIIDNDINVVQMRISLLLSSVID